MRVELVRGQMNSVQEEENADVMPDEVYRGGLRLRLHKMRKVSFICRSHCRRFTAP